MLQMPRCKYGILISFIFLAARYWPVSAIVLWSHVNKAIKLKQNVVAAVRDAVAANYIIPDQTTRALGISYCMLAVLLLLSKSLLNNRYN